MREREEALLNQVVLGSGLQWLTIMALTSYVYREIFTYSVRCFRLPHKPSSRTEG
jgi:hypothetical protein